MIHVVFDLPDGTMSANDVDADTFVTENEEGFDSHWLVLYKEGRKVAAYSSMRVISVIINETVSA